MSALAGWRTLLVDALVHSRMRILPWVALPVALSASSAGAYEPLFPEEADRMSLQVAISANPAFSFLLGPATDLVTVDGFTAWRSLALGGLLIGIGTTLTVTHLTRAQEESGLAELQCAQAVGRQSRLAVALLVAAGMSVAAGLVSAALTVAVGGGAEPSVLLAATYTAVGLLCTGVAAVASNLGADARTANTISLGVLGVMYGVRGVTQSLDLPEWTQWLSPLGWASMTDPAGEARWWPLAPILALAAGAMTVATILNGRREFGASLLAPRVGRARGRFTGLGAQTLRHARGVIVPWWVTAALMGSVFGGLTASMSDLVAADSVLKDILAAGAVTAEEVTVHFVRTILSILAVFAAFAGLQVVMKAAAEESERRLDEVLALPVPRWRWWATWTGIAWALTAVHVATTTLLITAVGANADVGLDVSDTLTQGVTVLVGAWVLVGVGSLLVAARPRLRGLAWALAGGTLLLDMLGPTMDAPDEVMALSVFHHVPTVGSADADWGPFLGVCAVAVALAALPFLLFRRRDIG